MKIYLYSLGTSTITERSKLYIYIHENTINASKYSLWTLVTYIFFYHLILFVYV
jgi:hypothetical protein